MDTRTLNRLTPLAAACVLAVAAGSAQAALVTASYTGTVTGVMGGSNQALSDHPAGTAVSWSFTFDDAFRSLRPSSGTLFSAASQPATGSVTVGGDSYTLDFANLFSYMYNSGTDEVLRYQFQITGTGPATASGGDFWGVWAQFSPTLDLLSSAVGFAYTTVSSGFTITNYSYLETAGSYRIGPAAQVPLPATAWLVMPALAWLVRRQQRRG